MTDQKNNIVPLRGAGDTAVGYKRPPVHSRFKPGQSGNPSGRARGSQNLKTLFHKILKEEVTLREGGDARKVTKAEAIMRGLVVGALKGDARSLVTLFRLAEQTGEFEETASPINQITRVIVSWKDTQTKPGTVHSSVPADGDIPAISDGSKEEA